MDAKDKTKGEEEQKKTRVRLTLTCKNLESVEKGNQGSRFQRSS